MGLRFLAVIASSLILMASQIFLPAAIMGNTWVNSITHFWGGFLSSWLSLLIFEIGIKKKGWGQNLLGFGAVFSAIFSCSVLLEILNFFPVKDEIYIHPRMYENLIDNLQLFFVLSFFLSLYAFQIGFEKRDILFASFCYIVGGALVSGALWELLEFYWFKIFEANAAQVLIYDDTVKDLFFDGLGGLALFIIYKLKDIIRNFLVPFAR